MHPIAASMPRQGWRQLVQQYHHTRRGGATAVSRLLISSPAPSSSFACSTRRAASTSTSSTRATPLSAQLSKNTSSFRSSSSSSSNGSSSRRSYSSSPPPPRKNTPELKFWPFVVVIALGSGGYMLLVNRRKDMPTIPPKNQQADSAAGRLPAPSKPTPTFSPDDVTVIFVLGGPGAGKGTQCANLVKDYGFTHLSAGDLLRAEQDRPGSQFGELIKDCIKNGAIVPMEVTVQLLENAMTEQIEKQGGKGDKKFLIDGFPRKMDQALKFEEVVCPAKFVLFYDCPEEEMERRLLERGKTSGRADDNADSIRKRFRTFVETSMPVVEHYEKEGRVVKVDATPKPEAVYERTRGEIKKFGI